MQSRPLLTSLTRTAHLEAVDYRIVPSERSGWERGDFVAGIVTGSQTKKYRVELTTGRMMDILEGDLLIGALGAREATLEATGSWEEVGDDGIMQLLTGAGLLGKCRSRSAVLPPLIDVRYEGHVIVDQLKASLQRFRVPAESLVYDVPTILLIGSSMSAGKTTAARRIIRMLKGHGYIVAGCKLTGAGRYRDILSMKDAGADLLLDFVDGGLASTIGPETVVRPALRNVLSRVAAYSPDVAVIEAGASPLEPYNGRLAIEMMNDSIRFTVLCASDPYSVLGVTTAYKRRPDIVTGIAASTDAATGLVQRLSGIPAFNILDKHGATVFERAMMERMEPYLQRTTPLEV